VARPDTAIIFYGGVDEIGGNKVLVKDRDVQVFFDFGMSFNLKRKYYSPPLLSPRSEKSLIELGILPKIDGVYFFDKGEAQVNAVFISHGHMDHSAYLSFIKREIPVHCGETTKLILQAFGEVRKTDLEFNVDDINFRSFRTGDKINIDGLEVEPIHVDHSVPGAYGFIIYTSRGAIIYTGDFRTHGAKPYLTHDFVEKAVEAKPVAIITEATNMTGAYISSEDEVKTKLGNIIHQAKGIVLAEFACTDIDRLNSFYQVAVENNRYLAISPRQAYLMEVLRKDKGLAIPDLDDEHILIFWKSKKTDGNKTLRKWERQIFENYHEKVISGEEASKKQSELILSMSLYDLEQLVEIKPIPGSCYISSSSEPFNEEMEIDLERLLNWLRHYGLPQYHIHVSGHVMPFSLRKILEEVGAAKIFPIHTENAHLFSKFVKDLKSETIIVKQGEEYKIE